jgi:hypothetical protein
MTLNKNIAVSETGFIFNPATGDSFSTNPVGQDVIRWLKEGKSRPEIASALTEKYAVDTTTADKDLGDFFQMLHTYQLLKDYE